MRNSLSLALIAVLIISTLEGLIDRTSSMLFFKTDDTDLADSSVAYPSLMFIDWDESLKIFIIGLNDLD